jgi:hypothetical protein
VARLDQDVAGALRLRDRMVVIAAEADLDDQAKLFAFCLAIFLNQRARAGVRAVGWQEEVGKSMYPPGSFRGDDPWRAVHRAIAGDVPRYEIPAVRVAELRCVALKSRGPRAGLPCDNQAVGQAHLDRDPDTGMQRWIGYCRNHTHPQLDKWRVERFREWHDNGCPSPPPNRGGILARLFPEGAWSRHYAWAGGYLPPRSAEQQEPREPQESPRPQLAVITGEGEAFGAALRPALSICDD